MIPLRCVVGSTAVAFTIVYRVYGCGWILVNGAVISRGILVESFGWTWPAIAHGVLDRVLCAAGGSPRVGGGLLCWCLISCVGWGC
jgi:hypothetical protein